MSHQAAYSQRLPVIARDRRHPLAEAVRRKPRIAMIQAHAEGAGAQEISRILGRGLEAEGYEVHHIFFVRRTAAFDSQPNAFFCALRPPAGIGDLMRIATSLIRHLRRLQPDAVLCFEPCGNIIGAMAARIAGAKAIIATRSLATAIEPRWARWLGFAFGITGLFDRIVVNAKAIEDEYRSCPRRYRRRVERIDHGFESKNSAMSRGAARRVFALADDITLLGCVARLHPFKNLDAAIRLLAINEHWHLALAGQGSARGRLENLAKSLGVFDRLHVMGELPPDRIATFLRTLDVFVFPSLAESFGLAVVEAAQAGVPVVANDLGVLREVLAVDGLPCALFVDAANPQHFAAGVQKLLDDDGLRAALTARGAGLCSRYSLQTMIARYVLLIEHGSVHAAERAG